MRISKEVNLASKITLMFTVITSLFALLGRLSTLIPIGKESINLEYFFKANIAWLITIVLIILILNLTIIKTDGRFNFDFIHNPLIRSTSGMMIIAEGFINLSVKVTALILNIQAFHQTSKLLGGNTDVIMSGIITSNFIPIALNVLQLLFGLYFIFYRKKDVEN